MTLPLWFILTILIAHWLGDFLLQSDMMALNKSKSFLWLATHVSVYNMTFVFIVPWMFIVMGLGDTPAKGWGYWIVLNFSLHFIIDAITSRVNAWLWQTERRHWFFVSIGFDQLLHYAVMFATAAWLMF